MTTSDWERFRRGDDAAFEHLYRTHYPVLFRYGRSLVHDDDLVRDCLHDVFVSLHRYRATLNPAADPKLYLIGTLRRTLADALRRERHRRERHGRWSEATPGAEPPLEDFITGDEAQRERLAGVKRAYEALPRRQREAIHLRFFAGLEYAQIAQLMQISHQSALNFVQRSLRRLEETSCPRPVPPFQCSPSAFYQACAGIFFLKNFLKKE